MAAKRDYRQVTKDPIIDLIRGEAQREGFVKGGAYKKIEDENEKRNISVLARDAGVSDTTLRNWFGGQTRRPQGFTSRLVLEALGVTTRFQRRDGTFIKLKSATS